MVLSYKTVLSKELNMYMGSKISGNAFNCSDLYLLKIETINRIISIEDFDTILQWRWNLGSVYKAKSCHYVFTISVHFLDLWYV